MGLAMQLSGAFGCCGGSQPWAVPRYLCTCAQAHGIRCWLAASTSGCTVRVGNKRTWGVALMTATSAAPSTSCSCTNHTFVLRHTYDLLPLSRVPEGGPSTACTEAANSIESTHLLKMALRTANCMHDCTGTLQSTRQSFYGPMLRLAQRGSAQEHDCTVQVEGRSLPCKACRAAYLKAVGAAEAVVQRLGNCAEDGFEFCHLIARLTSSEALDALLRVCRTSTMTQALKLVALVCEPGTPPASYMSFKGLGPCQGLGEGNRAVLPDFTLAKAQP